ncbi:MAG: DNA-binding response regulator [Armatimonadetes bacterium]|nr:MAG: DNA-binding response regulator [Armatimonadota bacterium]GIV01941.1 MAG: DNA-binding response regulator [Fimbriimonadales bacterium]
MIRVLIADDEDAYRKALHRILEQAPGIDCVGAAADGREALEQCIEQDVDVLLTDIEMPRMSGLECIRELKRRKHDIECVVLTVHEENETVFEALRLGAIGYLLKTSTAGEVIEAIERAVAGEAFLSPTIATKVLEEFRRQKEDETLADEHLYELSDREKEVLRLITQGLRNKEIAERLGVAEKTVKNHVSNILKALEVNTRTEAAMKAVRERLLGDGEAT